MTALEHLAPQEVCYLITRGRVTGRPHKVEMWFALNERTLYMLHEGTGGDWVKNVLHHPNVTVTFKEAEYAGVARLVKDHEEDALARQLLAQKYQKSEGHLVQWLRISLAVAVDLIM